MTKESKSAFDRFLDRQIEKKIRSYIQKYATKSDGTVDQALADRIGWEVGRRGETGKQLDIYEPLRWTGIRAVLGIGGAVLAKRITDKLKGADKKLASGIEVGVIVATVISSLIDLTRLYPRWLSGLEGGKNTALKLYEQREGRSGAEVGFNREKLSQGPASAQNLEAHDASVSSELATKQTKKSFLDHAKGDSGTQVSR